MNVLEVVFETHNQLIIQGFLLAIEDFQLFAQLKLCTIKGFSIKPLFFSVKILLVNKELSDTLKLVVLLLGELTLTCLPHLLHLLQHT